MPITEWEIADNLRRHRRTTRDTRTVARAILALVFCLFMAAIAAGSLR